MRWQGRRRVTEFARVGGDGYPRVGRCRAGRQFLPPNSISLAPRRLPLVGDHSSINSASNKAPSANLDLGLSFSLLK